MQEIERRIRGYAALGDHRAGRPGDDAATDWLLAELAAVGVAGAAQVWDFPQVDWTAAEVRLAAGAVDGIPLFDGALRSVRGRLGLAEAADGAEIVVAALARDDPRHFSAAVYPYLAQLEAAGAQAVVLIIGDPDGDHAVRNAEYPRDPLRLPVLQVAPRDGGPLLAAAQAGEDAELVIEGGRQAAAAANVVARIDGTEADASPVGLMTPKSGWFTCAAERGGGIAVWLELAARVQAKPGRRPLELVCSSGHELHHLGLEFFLEELGEAAQEVHAWLHLGASIGSRNGQARFAASDQALFETAQAALQRRQIAREPFPVGQSGFGEARNIGEIGGRFVSFLGGHPYFHSPQDTYDRCVDAESVARHIEAAEEILRAMLA